MNQLVNSMPTGGLVLRWYDRKNDLCVKFSYSELHTMNLMSFINRGAAHAPTEAQRARAAIVKAAEAARTQWLDALLVDQTRAWMSLGERQPEVLSAMATMLTIAGMAHAFDAKSVDTLDMRIIRGAISAATQCSGAGSVLRVEDARAFGSAAARAVAIINGASVDAIVHAAQGIREAVGA